MKRLAHSLRKFFPPYLDLVFLEIAVLILYIFLYKIYIPRVNAFGCFDDCSMFMAAYFMLKGKILYSQVFFNHQPLGPYISYLIQYFSHPINIYELVLRHRQFVFLFGLLFDLLLIARYRAVGFAFALFYEFSKFYVFGDRFLSEAMIVYPILYMIGLVQYKFSSRQIYTFDYILSCLFIWFIIFAREPYIPLVLFLYLLILWGRKFTKAKIISFLILACFSIMTVLTLPLKDYIFNVFTVNSTALSNGSFKLNMPQSVFYPFFIITKGGKWNILRYELIGLDIIFILSSLLLVLRYKEIKLFILAYVILILANLRPEIPGTMFYAAFHMISWYASFIFIVLLMLQEMYFFKNKIFYPLSLLFLGLFLYLIASPQSFIHERVNTHDEYIVNYGPVMQAGDVVSALSNPQDTLFLDGFDDIIYWEAKRPSPYKYSWYTSFMPGFVIYNKARLFMFAHNPPDFYYGTCAQGAGFPVMPAKYMGDYVRLYSGKNPSCLYVRKQKLATITKSQWRIANSLFYYLPSKENNI